MSEPVTIVTAAIIDHNGLPFTLPRPARHHTLIHAMAERGDPIPIKGTQGFMTSDGRFVDRKVAARIARVAGQMIACHVPGTLFSEDLW